MPLRICFVSAEMSPFAKAGGLADVAGALVKYLKAGGHDIRLFMPGYSQIRREGMERYPVEFNQTQWKTLMLHMRVRANLPADQARTILKYLQEEAGD